MNRFVALDVLANALRYLQNQWEPKNSTDNLPSRQIILKCMSSMLDDVEVGLRVDQAENEIAGLIRLADLVINRNELCDICGDNLHHTDEHSAVEEVGREEMRYLENWR
jgi:hypothetical protein